MPSRSHPLPAKILRASAPGGLLLPVVDVTHPAFRVDIDADELALRHAAFIAEQKRLPRPLRRLFYTIFLRRSLLAGALMRARGSFLDSMSTYMLKLGPENLPPPYDGPLDRKIAAATTGIAIRLRLQQMAGLLSGAIAPLITGGGDRPLHFVNIAGGPAMDTLNALILLGRTQREDLARRRIVIHTLDPGAEGVAFGRAALAALRGEDAPLAGLAIEAEALPYDWRETAGLRRLLSSIAGGRPIIACSSEGGLFEYGSDADIVANLRVLAEFLPADGVFAGSVTRDDDNMRVLKTFSSMATKPRSLEAFARLAKQGGFRIDRSLGTPMSDQVLLRPE